MTELHARVDVLEGQLGAPLVGAGAGLSKRVFTVLTLTRSDGTTGIGEASPLPGYSPDSADAVGHELRPLVDAPVLADPLASPFELLDAVFSTHPLRCPSACFALETALLDWLGRNREQPIHRLVGGDGERGPIPIADLVSSSDSSTWRPIVDGLVAEGATHVKLKIGGDLEREIEALSEIRHAHPALALRLDGNRRIPIEELQRHAGSLEALTLELLEEPVASHDWLAALDLPLPFSLDETLRERSLAGTLLDTGRIRAVVLKPTVLGGFRACLDAAEYAAARGAHPLVSHTFDGPIARAAAAELALALQTPLGAGLGAHPSLALWPNHATAAIRRRRILPHDSPGLGLSFEERIDG